MAMEAVALLRMYNKPTNIMVNVWYFGEGFSPRVACDSAIAVDDVTFGLFEINS